MDPTDISDVTGATLDFLVNGHSPRENWTGLFRAGERVRLRIVNAASQTLFNLRIPGLAMTVVAADGVPVRPVTVDELQIGNAETYDLIVTPEDRAYTFVAEAIGNGNACILKDHRAGWLRIPAHLALVSAERQPGRIGLDDQRRDAAGPLAAGAHHHDIDIAAGIHC